jgi:small subunit ribosomal protein S2
MEWLVPLEEYIKAGVHVGTRIKTEDMRKFIAKVKEDGLAILDITKTDERLRLATRFLARYEPNEILVVGRRETARRPIRILQKYTKMLAYPGRYPPGLLTNPQLKDFKDVEVVLITDPILDRNALMDAFNTNKVIISLVDTNNTLKYIDFAIPTNNKGARALALIYYIITREYLRNRGVIPRKAELDVGYEYFIEQEEIEEI